jgi:hypothetical protein
MQDLPVLGLVKTFQNIKDVGFGGWGVKFSRLPVPWFDRLQFYKTWVQSQFGLLGFKT